MILLLRGHIRNSFDNDTLYRFVRKLYETHKVDIYIQTWNVYSNTLSWRPIKANSTVVDEAVLKAYFRDVPIKQTLILDDTKITLSGNLSGVVMSSMIPTVGWKNMWYGKFAAAELVKDQDTTVINTRFDLFSTLNRYNEGDILRIIDRGVLISNPPYISFMANSSLPGIDNLYIATAAVNYALAKHFHENLDSMTQYAQYGQPERVVFLEARRLFGSPPQTVRARRPLFPSKR